LNGVVIPRIKTLSVLFVIKFYMKNKHNPNKKYVTLCCPKDVVGSASFCDAKSAVGAVVRTLASLVIKLLRGKTAAITVRLTPLSG
jgi:hypothetical protein